MDKGKPIMYINNSLGPRTDPCGTPDSTERVDDLEFLTTTL